MAVLSLGLGPLRKRACLLKRLLMARFGIFIPNCSNYLFESGLEGAQLKYKFNAKTKSAGSKQEKRCGARPRPSPQQQEKQSHDPASRAQSVHRAGQRNLSGPRCELLILMISELLIHILTVL